MRVHDGQCLTLWHKPTPSKHDTTIKWGGSAVSMWGWRMGGVYLRYQAQFSIFWCTKNKMIFQLFWHWWPSFEYMGQNNNQHTIQWRQWLGFVMLFGKGGWKWATWNRFVSQKWYLDTLLRTNNNIGSVDPILHNSGKNTLTQQSTDNGERFLAVYDDDGTIWQPTTWDLFIFSSKIS